ncbi:MAG TPA: MBL fold metallo-hydrolase [Chitinophagales bacterium]|nr:MBL fold metallo-hydrolase [Chitinophagales bacterium]HMW12576.1 MBL fold metallo-hydrolase [Chitinophagales bacterium]HMX59840.1 MBL fold metallo-hydrolase [Chitinophagales bacterium]HMZ33473.1 MBL fold metallo-hydrolase [Chitinophagales bacterium]HNA38354.1 MBL fold metallo-hydrolase [Chitinophagales bacterium]
MKIEQIYTGCLAQGAYFIESNGEVAIIDPLREVQPYIDMATKRNAKIKYIFETHFHADFVSGHVDLAKETGATIIYGPTAMETGYAVHKTHDGEVFTLGNATITVLHTPGHTMESICLLLTDSNGKKTALFTGDTLFIGDVGRPDLAQHVVSDLTQEKLAAHLFDSLRNKIMPLPDDLIVYPAHGAGSACGKNMSKETSDTLGNQKKTNYALNPSLTKEEFIKQVLDGLVAPPSYFPKNVLLNITGYDSIEKVIDRGTRALTPDEFEAIANETNALLLDTRSPSEFNKAFIPNSINIGIDGSFAVWVGTLVSDIKQAILLITEPGREEEVITRLSRVGYDNTIGYLDGGIAAWQRVAKETDSITSITADELAQLQSENPALSILDVRKKSEYFSEHIQEAENLPLDFINDTMQQIEKNKTYYVHCAGGYRSMIFTSILRARGYHNLIDVAGGFAAIKKSEKFELTDYVCPTTML